MEEVCGVELRLFLKEIVDVECRGKYIKLKWKDREGSEKTISIPKDILRGWDTRFYAKSDLKGLELVKLIREAIRDEILRALAVERKKEG